MAEETAERTQKRKRTGRIARVVLSAVVLLLLNTFVLAYLSLVEQITMLEQRVSVGMDRLSTSIVSSRDNTVMVTSIYNSWYSNRLSMIRHIAENEYGDYSNVLEVGLRYLDDPDLFVADSSTGILIDYVGEKPESELLSNICTFLQAKTDETSLYTNGKHRYYSIRLNQSRVLVLRESQTAYEVFMDNIYSPEEVISTNLTEGNNVSLAVRAGTILLAPNKDDIGKKTDEVVEYIYDLEGIESELSADTATATDDYSVLEIDGKELVTLVRRINDADIELYHGTALDTIFKITSQIMIPLMLAVTFLVVLYLLYSYYLRDDYVNKRVSTGITKQILRYKSTGFIILAVVFTAAAAYYCCTMTGLSDFISSYPRALSNAEAAYYDSVVCSIDMQAAIEDAAVYEAKMISAYLSDHPERRTPEELQKLSEIFSSKYIMMFDRTGSETVSDSIYENYSISTDSSAQSYTFNSLKKGIPHVVRRTAVSELTGESDWIVGVTTKDENGVVDGFLQLVLYPEQLNYAKALTEVSATFDNSVLSNTFENFAVDIDSGNIIYCPAFELIGSPAAENGFNEDSLRSGFTGYLDVGGVTYFAASKQVQTMYLYTALPVDTIFYGRSVFVAAAAVMVLVTLLLLTRRMNKTMIRRRTSEELEADPPAVQHNDDGTVRVQTDDDVYKETLEASKRLSLLPRTWAQQSAEEKFNKVIGNILLVSAVIFLIIVELRDQLFGENNLISYILGMTWPRGINAFSVSASVIMVIMVSVGAAIIRSVLLLFARLLNARGETVCRLLRSCVKYIAAIACVYLVLSFFGMDVRSLAASVGFLALVVSFGARSLITDIVAGLFIIFEGEFQVGDIVEIGGYKGMVREIGLRTTKIISWDKNVKVISNRNISSIVNMTMRNSFATVKFSVPITIDLDAFEKVLEEELKELPKKYPVIIGEPFFSGVSSFNGKRMECWVSAEVEELKRGDLEKQLHKEVQEILRRHDIPME